VSDDQRGHTTMTPSRPATAKLRVAVTAMTPMHHALLPLAAALTWRGASLRTPTSLWVSAPKWPGDKFDVYSLCL